MEIITTTKEEEMQIEIITYQGSSLPGFQAICPHCGLQMKNTVEENVRLDVKEHIAHHAKKR